MPASLASVSAPAATQAGADAAPSSHPALTDGMWDAEGRFVPHKLIKPVDSLRNDMVLDLVGPAVALSKRISDFKRDAFDEMNAFLDLAAEKYGIDKSAKGNVVFYSFDGRYKIVRSAADQLVFGESLLSAKKLIDECLTTWTEGSNEKIRVLVMDAFQVDRTGRISISRVLRLRQLDISDEKWLRAMKAIDDSIRVVATKSYVRFYERQGDSDNYAPILLDMASVTPSPAREPA